MKKTRKQIYLKAMDLVWRGLERYTCLAIETACRNHGSWLPITRKYWETFTAGPDGLSLLMGLYRKEECPSDMELRNFRILLLCMALAAGKR